MSNTNLFKSPCVQADIKSFLNSLDSLGEQDAFDNMRIDFLEMCFAEFISSDRFVKLDSDRRKDLFEQYQLLGLTLDTLSSFNKKYPTGIKFKVISS